MKLPYRVGDTFTMPVGDGSVVEAQIVAHDHHTVDIAVSDLVLRVSDRALVLHRWRRLVTPSPSTSLRINSAKRSRGADVPINDGWIGPAHAERIVATHLGIANVELPPLHVHNRWTPVTRRGYMRVAQRGLTLDPRSLPPEIEVLDCSGVTLASCAFPPTLRALRLAWISTPIDLRELAALPLHTLHLEELRELRAIEALSQCTSLQQLEMLGFWQLTLPDVEPLLAHSQLVRAEIDIGGRRKNVELYKRASWAYPWPFDAVMKR